MFKLIKIALGAAVAATTLAAAAAPAAAMPAWPGEEVTSVVVSFAGLDLSKRADAARLDRRIRAAAVEVCGTVPTRDLAFAPGVAGCQKEAISRAKAEVTLAMRGGGTQVATLRPD
jgi:UrcA family protein